MLDRQFIRQHPDTVREGARKKGVECPLDSFKQVDSDFRALRSRLDLQRGELNDSSKAIGQLMAQGKTKEADATKAQAKVLSESIKDGEQEERELEKSLRELELQFPNLPHESVPDGNSPSENKIVRTWGEEPKFEFKPRPHWDLGARLGLFDNERGSKIAGSGFPVYRRWGATLQRALINWMVDTHRIQGGYEEIYPPYLVNRESLTGTGQLPKFEQDLYRTDADLFLIPTAEVPVTNLYRDEILEASQLPIRLVAFSGCFRKEAGAAGKDTRGIQRVHQFDKVELVKYATPETSYEELESLTEDAERILQALGLYYRVVLVCAGEMSFSNSKQYDLEVWAPGVGAWLEVSSCSNFESFQARRANIRFKSSQGEKAQFVHTLNGSALALPRTVISILEQFQAEDGSVSIPEPLQAFMKADRIEPSA